MREPAPSPLLSERFDRAVQRALDLHRTDLRKHTSVPYASHLLGVAALVLEDGGSEDEAIAALLHDVLEDHPEQITAAEIERAFGAGVRRLVGACTDTAPDYRGGDKGPWRPRKERYLEHIRAGGSVNRVSLADKLHNARSILRDLLQVGDAVWDRFSVPREETLWYYRALVRAFRDVGATGWMIDELDRTVAELERRTRLPPAAVALP